MTTDEIVDRLASHRTIGNAPREELAWLAAHGTLSPMRKGEFVSHRSDAVAEMVVILSGCVALWAEKEGKLRRVTETRAGEVGGVLPYSRLASAPGDIIVEEPGEVLRLPKALLPDLIQHCPEITAALVHTMTDRARLFASAGMRDDKLASLGKLAAGLAHELNNPASAAMRSAKSIAASLSEAEAASRALRDAHLTPDERAAVDRLYDLCVASLPAQGLSGLALSDREEEMSAWLEEHEADTAMAGDLARAPVTREQLDGFAGTLQERHLELALRWITSGYAVRCQAADIERATSRIHTLVSSMKGFTHMDREPDPGPVDVLPGLQDTVALLSGKAQEKSVTVTLTAPADLPPIRGLSAEVNQIWMNLIDNAIDAVPKGGEVTLYVTQEGGKVVVRVLDNGPGIPPEIRERIFDPFFTTKPVGEGTGLGLDIVRRIVNWHNGEIEVASGPGQTEFRVSLPVSS